MVNGNGNGNNGSNGKKRFFKRLKTVGRVGAERSVKVSKAAVSGVGRAVKAEARAFPKQARAVGRTTARAARAEARAFPSQVKATKRSARFGVNVGTILLSETKGTRRVFQGPPVARRGSPLRPKGRVPASRKFAGQVVRVVEVRRAPKRRRSRPRRVEGLFF